MWGCRPLNKTRRVQFASGLMVRRVMDFNKRPRTNAIAVALFVPVLASVTGCEVQSFLDPSKTGYFQHTPITMPILERVDVIERGQHDQWEVAEEPTAADLVPS